MPEDGGDVEEELQETEEEIKSMIESIEENSATPDETSVDTSGSDEQQQEDEEKNNRTEDGKYVDGDTGRKFDTEEGLELFQQALEQK